MSTSISGVSHPVLRSRYIDIQSMVFGIIFCNNSSLQLILKNMITSIVLCPIFWYGSISIPSDIYFLIQSFILLLNTFSFIFTGCHFRESFGLFPRASSNGQHDFQVRDELAEVRG